MTEAIMTTPAGSYVVAEYDRYADAQRLVDRMSDEGFPVQHVRIVGTGIRSVEQVTGRLTNGRAALNGAANGAWTGLFIGALFALFALAPALSFVLLAVLMGAVFGGVAGFVGHWATRGRRDFSSFRSLEAARYAVEVEAGHVADAQRFVAHV